MSDLSVILWVMVVNVKRTMRVMREAETAVKSANGALSFY